MNEAAPAARSQKKKRKPAGSRRAALGNALAVFIVFIAFYLIIILFAAGTIYYSFKGTAKNTEIYSVRLVYDENVLHKLTAEAANNEYGLYIPFSYLTEIGSFGLAADGDDVTLFIIGTDNRIRCTKNSSLIVINDNPIRISAPILYGDEDYLIPMVLIENYITGINVEYDEKLMICSVSSAIGKTNVALKLLLPEEMKPADFPDSYKYYTTTDDNR